MKRKLISLCIVLALACSLCLTVHASGTDAPRIVDNADLLTPDEEFELESMAQYLRNVYDMDVVILTEDSIGSQSPVSYAENFYDGNGYGVGARGDGVLLLIVMDTRQWYISTCGAAMKAIPDREVDTLADSMLDYLSDGAYFYAFSAWMDALEPYFDDYRMEYGYDSGDGDMGIGLSASTLGISAVVGLVVGGVVLLILRSMMNNKLPSHGARDYLKDNSANLKVQRDIFLYSRVQKTPKPKNNSSSGGRVGGGGRSHGGGGGRF